MKRRTLPADDPPAAEPTPTIRREGPTIVACTDGLRGVVSRWHCSATQLGELVSLVRLSGGAAPRHPRTVERHRVAVREWLRGGPAARQSFRYLYHHACSAITRSRAYSIDGLPAALRERTHVCLCSAWRVDALDGSLAVWRSGAWREPAKGEIKSKVCERQEDAPVGAVEALQRPTRARCP